MVILIVILVIVFLGAVLLASTAKSDPKREKMLEEQKKKQAARDIKTKTLMEQQNALLEEISRKIGSVDVNIPIKIERSVLNMEWVYIPYADESFYASLSTKQIYYKGRFVAFDKIVNCDYSDNATTTSTQSGTASSTIKTNTGSTVGRALVGGVIAGPVGAAIGGATAKKNAETKIENKTISTTKHNYTVRIHIADIVNPLLEIKCGENEDATHKIVSTIFAIIEQNKQLSH